MAGFDPLQKFETWVFQKVGTRATGQPIYRRLGWNYVEYDGDPDRKVEPVSQPRPELNAKQIDNYGGQVVGFELVEGRSIPTFALGEKIDTTGAL